MRASGPWKAAGRSVRVDRRRRGGGRGHRRGLVRRTSCAAAGPGGWSLVERSTLGQGASSRAAGIVRSQGGTPTAVRLAEWSRAFYRRQHDELRDRLGLRAARATSCPASPRPTWPTARARMAMQQGLGLDVRWLDADEADALNPTMAPGVDPRGHLPRRRRLHPPAAQRRWPTRVALAVSGVEVHERVAFDGPGDVRRPGHRGGDQRGRHRHRAGGPHRRARAGRGGTSGRGPRSPPAASATRWR